MGTQEAEGVRLLLVADTLDTLLFFTNRGRVLSLKCHRIPQDSSRAARGTPLVQLISMDEKEQVTEILAVSSFSPGDFMVMATRSGEIKRTALKEFTSVRSGGLIALSLEKGDELMAARVAHQDDEVTLVTERGQAIRFAVAGLRIASRSSGGVRAIQLSPGDRVVAMDTVSPEAYLLVVTANGFGKCTPLADYRRQARGGRGVKSLSLSPKSGRVTAARIVDPADELLILSALGHVIRIRMEDIPIQGRIRRGASLMKPGEGDEVVAIAPMR